MAKYIKKPVAIEADVYSLGMEDGLATIGEAIIRGWRQEGYKHPECAKFMGVPYIKTLEGDHFISEGDYIIIGVQGERYPCKPDIFNKTYYTEAEYAAL